MRFTIKTKFNNLPNGFIQRFESADGNKTTDMKILEVSFRDLQMIIASRHPQSKFYTKDLQGEKVLVINLLTARVIKQTTRFIGCDNTSGDAFIAEFEYLEDCLNWLNDK